MFADDTTIFVKNTQSLKAVLKVLSEFAMVSSLNINKNKSNAALIGKSRNKKDTNVSLNDINWIDLDNDAMKILDVYYSYNNTIVSESNFKKLETKVEKILNLWSSRALTIYGRAEIVRSLAISKMLYVFNVIDPPQSTLKYLKTLLSKFIWRGKKPKIKHTTIIGDYDVGGIKFTDLEIRLSVQRIMWIKRLQTSPNSLISRLSHGVKPRKSKL